ADHRELYGLHGAESAADAGAGGGPGGSAVADRTVRRQAGRGAAGDSRWRRDRQRRRCRHWRAGDRATAHARAGAQRDDPAATAEWTSERQPLANYDREADDRLAAADRGAG